MVGHASKGVFQTVTQVNRAQGELWTHWMEKTKKKVWGHKGSWNLTDRKLRRENCRKSVLKTYV